jgi:hypothetical protein
MSTTRNTVLLICSIAVAVLAKENDCYEAQVDREWNRKYPQHPFSPTPDQWWFHAYSMLPISPCFTTTGSLG